MSGHYRRDGTPYPDTHRGLLEWARDFEDKKNKRVARDTLKNGIFVSTVWLGLDHNFSGEPPLIFETMVFSDKGDELDRERYSTEKQAIAGHLIMMTKWKHRTKGENGEWVEVQ